MSTRTPPSRRDNFHSAACICGLVGGVGCAFAYIPLLPNMDAHVNASPEFEITCRRSDQMYKRIQVWFRAYMRV